ncbi:pyrroline-5-carboxylate reductase [bacterium]|jgi:pyrroline-5-carboxylate reductase|nr:pyrroline-5-carboxylate reductase [bacterium]MBT6831920.1 pyrroline-5-carboxylate reductase [bacterium]MBT6996616.1 pyrroline-5-carboxylate reductase [bacterium]MBT7773036.1 pyrroline-5-carboxylate reductase [bacterium]
MLSFLGCGNMGGAILDGIVRGGVFSPEKILVANRESEKNLSLKKKYGIGTTLEVSDLETCEIVILGIKPQGLDALEFSPKKNAIVISLLVGTPVAKLQKKFPDARIVRTMPNLGQFAGRGMTGIFFAPDATFSPDEKSKILEIFSAGGKVLNLDSEEKIDGIGAISGSGPAYFFQFAENLVSAAQKLGFSPEESEILIRQTMLGAGEVAENFSEISLGKWKKRVMSPGGTTEQAIRVFNEFHLEKIVDDAVAAAMKRTRELSK